MTKNILGMFLQIAWEAVDNGIVYYGQANTVMTFLYNSTTGLITLLPDESFNVLSEYATW